MLVRYLTVGQRFRSTVPVNSLKPSEPKRWHIKPQVPFRADVEPNRMVLRAQPGRPATDDELRVYLERHRARIARHQPERGGSAG
jgi:hypothetical protein